jgi:hypothetical protein
MTCQTIMKFYLSCDLSQKRSDMLELMKKQQDQYEGDRLILSRVQSTAENMTVTLHN